MESALYDRDRVQRRRVQTRSDEEAGPSEPAAVSGPFSVPRRQIAESAWEEAAVLDLIGLPVIVVADNGIVIDAKAAARALLREGHDLTMRSGRLHLIAADAMEQLQAAIRSCRQGARQQMALSIPRVPRSPIRLLLARVRADDAAGAVAVFVLDRERPLYLSAGLIAEAYGLTSAEGRVAVELLRGQELREIARTLEVSVFTVRSHVRNALSKTGARNLRDLVRRLALEVGVLSLSAGPVSELVNLCDSKPAGSRGNLRHPQK